MAKKEDPKKIIDEEVNEVFELEKSLQLIEAELLESDTFRKFLDLQQRIKAKSDEMWKRVGTQMVELYEAGIIDKNLKYDWGLLTVTRNVKLKIDEKELPPRFKKTVPDTTKIHALYDLEGTVPKGVEVTIEHGFRKTLKKV